jgi:carbonic anhydrase/acetyltransferase-like protein (isoleucine patch superfamily)
MKPVVRGVVRAFDGVWPTFGEDVFVADTATVVGDVTLGDGCSVWFAAVLRGDVMPIRVGRRCNFQDGVVVHATTDLSSTVLGDECTIGHRAILHGCTLGHRVLVGMGAIVLDNATVGDEAILAAGSLVPPRTNLPGGFVYVGSPARAIRALRESDREMIASGWKSYVDLSRRHGVE